MDIFLAFGSIYSLLSLLILNSVSSYVIIPGISVLIASYSSFQTNIQGLIFFTFFIWLSSLVGDYSVYIVSRKLSNPVRKFLSKFNWFTKNEEKVRSSFKKHEFSAVFFSRFLVSGTGPIVNYLAGIEKLNAKKYFLAVLSGEFIFALIYCSIGYAFKDTWQELLNTVQYGFVAIALIALAIYIVYRLAKHYNHIRSRKL